MIFHLFEQFINSTDVENVLENAFKNADPADFASFDNFDDVEFEVEAEKGEVIEKMPLQTAKSTTTTSTKATTTTKTTTTTKARLNSERFSRIQLLN